MINPVSTASPAQAVEQPKAASPAPAQPSAQPPAVAKDTVQISAAAKAMQELVETPAQTAKEAASGDLQAKHLLAREAAQKGNH